MVRIIVFVCFTFFFLFSIGSALEVPGNTNFIEYEPDPNVVLDIKIPTRYCVDYMPIPITVNARLRDTSECTEPLEVDKLAYIWVDSLDNEVPAEIEVVNKTCLRITSQCLGTEGSHSLYVAVFTNNCGNEDCWDKPYNCGSTLQAQTYQMRRGTELTILDARMVSPDELGIAVKVKYDEKMPPKARRSIDFRIPSLNGKEVKYHYRVNVPTPPGKTKRIGWDAKSKRVSSQTPIRINLAEKGVPRFEQNIHFDIIGEAKYEGGPVIGYCPYFCPRSSDRKNNIEIKLPVVVLHGYMTRLEPLGSKIEIRGYPAGITAAPSGTGILNTTVARDECYNVAYRLLSDTLKEAGYTPFKAGSYVTLWDPKDRRIGYSSLSFAIKTHLQQDYNRIFKLVKKNSYADKFDIVGHSTGGLVARFWATKNPGTIRRIITVGTPHKGATEFYIEAFRPEYSGRNNFITQALTIPGTDGTPNLITWFAPQWDAVDESLVGSVPATGNRNPYFNNTFGYGFPSDVQFYLLYRNNYSTPYAAVIENNEDNQWYVVDHLVRKGGDNYVYGGSASAAGINGENIEKVKINVPEKHDRLLRNLQIRQEIVYLLEY